MLPEEDVGELTRRLDFLIAPRPCQLEHLHQPERYHRDPWTLRQSTRRAPSNWSSRPSRTRPADIAWLALIVRSLAPMRAALVDGSRARAARPDAWTYLPHSPFGSPNGGVCKRRRRP
jgi:hypothetical protein